MFQGPIQRLWLGKIEKIKYFSNSFKSVVLKIILDQTIFVPPYLFTLMFLLYGLQGNTFDNIMEKIKKNFLTVYKVHADIWCDSQLINYMVVPLNYQVLVLHTASCFWNVFLSWKINRN